jgi:hypothetical protein
MRGSSSEGGGAPARGTAPGQGSEGGEGGGHLGGEGAGLERGHQVGHEADPDGPQPVVLPLRPRQVPQPHQLAPRRRPRALELAMQHGNGLRNFPRTFLPCPLSPKFPVRRPPSLFSYLISHLAAHTHAGLCRGALIEYTPANAALLC